MESPKNVAPDSGKAERKQKRKKKKKKKKGKKDNEGEGRNMSQTPFVGKGKKNQKLPKGDAIYTSLHYVTPKRRPKRIYNPVPMPESIRSISARMASLASEEQRSYSSRLSASGCLTKESAPTILDSERERYVRAALYTVWRKYCRLRSPVQDHGDQRSSRIPIMH